MTSPYFGFSHVGSWQMTRPHFSFNCLRMSPRQRGGSGAPLLLLVGGGDSAAAPDTPTARLARPPACLPCPPGR